MQLLLVDNNPSVQEIQAHSVIGMQPDGAGEKGISIKEIRRQCAGGFLSCLSGILLEDDDAGGLQAFLAGFNSELHFLTFFERAEAVALDG